MRLWHLGLIPRIDSLRLLAQHRECCALRGNGWGRKHSTVDYVFTHSRLRLYFYHLLVMQEMRKRDYNITNSQWFNSNYRGAKAEPDNFSDDDVKQEQSLLGNGIYPEHNEEYLRECIVILRRKGASLIFEDGIRKL